LRVTFGVNPFSKWDFDSLPRNTNEDMQGFVFKDDQCSGGKFAGKRYWYQNDTSALILVDVNGYVAGFQTSVPKSTGWVPSPVMLGTYIIEEDDAFTLTVYFVDPSIICNGGRTADQYASQGTGTDLYIQNGPDPLKKYVYSTTEGRRHEVN